jgi:hypothetical protein
MPAVRRRRPIRGNLECSGNLPAVQVGDSEDEPNVVTGHKTGE